MVMGYDGDYQMSAIYKIKSGLRKAILAKGSSCSVTSGVMHKGGGGRPNICPQPSLLGRDKIFKSAEKY